jgi:hypothetical protein
MVAIRILLALDGLMILAVSLYNFLQWEAKR